MKTPLLLAAAILIPFLPVSAATILIDFGENTTARMTASPDTNGNHWNNVVRNNAYASGLALINTAGVDTGISLRVTSGFNVTANQNGSAYSGTAFVGSLPGSATIDSLYSNVGDLTGSGTTNPSITLSGFTPGVSYSFTIFASRTATDNRTGQYTFTGSTAGTGFLNAASNTSNTLTIANIAPTAEGTIVFTMTGNIAENTNANKLAYLNVMQISYSAIPEPSTFALLVGVGALGLVLIRRRPVRG